MKNLIAISILTLSINCFSQTEYYSTSGTNRLTKTELDNKISELEAKIKEISKNEVSISLKTRKTENKKDSIIHYISFDVKTSNSINEPLTKFKDKSFPETKLTNLNGEEIQLPISNGKPTLINFWFTKCAPCIDEMPILNEIRNKYLNDFNFISITYNEKEDVEKFLEKYQFDFQHFVDAKEFTDMLGIQAYPMNLFLDKSGVLKYVKYGIPYESKAGGELKIGDGNEFIKIIEELK